MKRYIFIFIIPIFFLACARQTSPTGGPKDTIPPILIKSYPKNGAVQFKENQMTLTFDEAVTLQNPKEQIIIIPNIDKEYEIVAKRNSVTLDLKTKLADSTTYSITFRDAIIDITEKNIPKNLKIAFSTGAYIDSLSIKGKVSDLLTNKESKDVTIALYQSDTFNIFKHKPIYVTKSDEKGYFQLTNLKNGEYYLYAFQDKNRNLITDSKTESYAYINSKVNLQSNIDSAELKMIKLDMRPLKVTSARPYNTYYNIKTTKPLTDYKLTSAETEIISSYGEDNSIIKVYKNFTLDSLRLRLTGTDSALNKLDTTLYAKFSDRLVIKEKFTATIRNSTLIQSKGYFESTISFTKPLLHINTDSILIKLDSLNAIHFTADDILIDSINKKLTLSKKIDKQVLQNQKPSSQPPTKSKPKEIISNQFYLGKGALVSIENDSTENIKENLKLLTTESTGVLLIKVETNVTNFIVQVKDKSFNTVKSSINKKDIRFEDLIPGEYQIFLIIDTDSNQKWSPGNKLMNIEPEKIHYYRNDKGLNTLTLKANWELGPLLITDR